MLDHWWQTETGWPITGNIVGLDGYVPVKYGSAFPAVPGYDVKILNDAHEDVPPNTQGNMPSLIFSRTFASCKATITCFNRLFFFLLRCLLGSIVIKLPLPPGTLLSLYNNHDRFEESYMKNVPGYYDTGDAGLIDEGAQNLLMTLLFMISI